MQVRKHSALWMCLIVVIEVVVLFIGAEIAASFFLPPGLKFIHPQMLIEPDARRAYFHRPNQKAFTIDQPFMTNSLGFRDEREVPAQKEGEFRIFALGDSLTVGLGVAVEDTYPRQLEKLLERRNVPVRVINGGVGGYGTWQEVDVLKEKGHVVKPDIVTLAFYWNDLYTRPTKVTPMPENESGEQQDASLKYLRVFKRSRVLLFLRERWASLSNMRWPTFDWTQRDMIYKGLTSPYLEQAYGDVEKSIDEFKSLQGGNDFVPVLIIVPLPMQVQQPDVPPTHMQQRITAIAHKAGLHTLDLLPAMRQAYAEKPDLYIPWDHEHFTPRGNQVVAEVLERYLTTEHLVPSPQGASANAPLLK